MVPVRVGIVGLSANASGSSWAKMTHLPYLKASPHYEIAGVLNSSLASSQTAIDAFELANTKPYADIDSMASDPNIDFIVVCVEVKLHASMVKAAIANGKRVYCEWPLGRNFEEANELAALAKEKDVPTYVGLESRISPPILKLRELITSNAIGKITSTDVTGTLGPLPKVWSEQVLFYLNVHSGQSPLHTRLGHFIDAFCYTVREFESLYPLLVTHQKEIKVYDVPLSQLEDAAKNPITPSKIVKRTAPDEVFLQGVLTGGIVALFHIRSGDNDTDGNMLRWLIAGTEGLIEVTQKAGQFLRDKSVDIKMVKNSNVTMVDIPWDTNGEFNMFGDQVVFTTPGRNYKAIAENIEGGFANFDYAAKRHKMIDDIIERCHIQP